MQWVKPPLVTPVSHIRGLAGVSPTLLQMQLPTKMPGKATEHSSSAWLPADLNSIIGSWLWPDPGLAIVAIWEMNQGTEDLSESLTLPFKPINKSLKKKYTGSITYVPTQMCNANHAVKNKALQEKYSA